MHAIPEFQTGAAGGFSSPFVTLQLGGQMLGDIASAFAASLEKVMSKHETEADLAAAQAEYQRRREEWQHELELLAKEKAQIEKRIAETQLEARDQRPPSCGGTTSRSTTRKKVAALPARQVHQRAALRLDARAALGRLLPGLQGRVRRRPAGRARVPLRARRSVVVVHRVLLLGQPEEGPVRRRAAAPRSAAHGGGVRRGRSARARGHAAHLAAARTSRSR